MEIWVIRQTDVEQVFPEVVRTTPEGKKALAYHELLAICVEAIKKLEQKTYLSNNLKSDVIQLTQLTNDMQNQINKLKQNTMIEKTVSIDNNSTKNGDDAILFQNIPNPYSTQTAIKCLIPSTVKSAIINIYDLNGTQIKTIEIIERGEVTTTISASELHAGMYLYSLISDNKIIGTKTMVLTSH